MPGLYHYDIKGHALSILWKRSFTLKETRQHSLLLSEEETEVTLTMPLPSGFS